MFLKNNKTFAALVASALLAAGCGGGGGGGSDQGGGSATASNSWLQFTPSSVDVNTVEGFLQEFTVVGKSSKTIAQTINVGIVDKTGLIQPAVELKAISPLEYSVKMKLAATLKPGSYSTRLEVRLCEDNPLTCTKPIDGSPWYVPLNVTVKAATNLTPLTKLPGGATWYGYGGSTARTNYISGNFDPAKFSTRFIYAFDTMYESPKGGMFIDDGIVYMNVSQEHIRAIDESSGKVLWDKTLGANRPMSVPAVVGERLYVAINEGKAQLQVFDKKTGVSDGAFDIGSFDNRGGVAVHSGGLLFSNGSIIKRANPTTRQVVWETATSTEPALITADADNIFAFLGSNLRTFRASDGATISEQSTSSAKCSDPHIHATDGKGMLYGVCSTVELRAIDTIKKQSIWSASGFFRGEVALAGSTLYTLNSDVLEARNAVDGKVVWSIKLVQGTDALRELSHVLVTDNLVFVSSDGPSATEAGKTVAVDLMTHKVVWSYPHGGGLALSANGVLYIGGSNYNLATARPPFIAAINLR